MLTDRQKIELLYDETTYGIIGAAIEVHRELVLGVLPSWRESGAYSKSLSVSIGVSSVVT